MTSSAVSNATWVPMRREQCFFEQQILGGELQNNGFLIQDSVVFFQDLPIQNLSLLVHLLGERLLDPFQSLFSPPKNHPGCTSSFFGKICQTYMVFQVSTNNLGFLRNRSAFFLPISRERVFPMCTSFLVREIA